jgi:hypothetical protein
MFSCYLKMERRQSVKKDGTESKTPRYVATGRAGYFKPLDSIKNAKGEIVMYCQRNDKCNHKSKAEIRLQCQYKSSSVNFSSIYFLDIEIGKSLIGYGEPPDDKMLKSEMKKNKDGSITEIKRPNPFYESRWDGYLFLISSRGDDGYPNTIEILVVHDCRALIHGAAKKLADGQFDEELKQMRDTAK